MSGKFVRASKYRHVYGQVAKKERQYENIRVTNNAWDSNLIQANSKFLAVNWNSSGGGAFAVIPLDEVGKAPDQVPLFRGHTAHVLDTDFNPFDDYCIASGSDDGKIGIWEIPKDYSFHNYTSADGEPKDLEPKKFLQGHGRKVGHVLFHPTAQNVLASSSLDYTVKIWDISTGKELFNLKHPDMVTSMSFSYNGNHLVTVSRDKKLRVWDIRAGKIVSEGPAHTGAKNQRVVWLGNSDRIATTGFSKLSDRQVGIWDAFNLEKGDLGGFYTLDQSSGIVMPFYDDSNKILYLVGKGDGNIRYFEFQNDELFELSEFQSVDPQRGFAAAPRRAVSVKNNEILKGFKTVNDHCIEPISFHVPRKADSFQDDIYPDAPSHIAALSAEEWASGKSTEGPLLFNMKSLFDGSEPMLVPSSAGNSEPVPPATTPSAPAAEEPSASEKGDVGQKEESTPQSTEKTLTRPPSPVTIPKPSAPKTSKENGSSTAIDETLKEDKTVNGLLMRASQLDKDNDAEDPSKDVSTWDEGEDNVPPAELPPPVSSASRVEESKLVPAKTEKSKTIPQEAVPATQTPTPEATPSQTKIKTSTSSPATRLEEKVEEFTTTTSDSNVSDSTVAPTAKTMGLKQSVETLSGLVLQLSQVVDDLKRASLEKDTRLKAVEDKLAQLVGK
ncbi:LADA_0H14202g1_1 [Lachancea dasiensis]|uniref:Coronin n=1 Tax=Lachancea dasiensis TaxID=1072105 RepID=A0A1G4K4B2_9SACH|nr:LADA_0H14202g1_1 [Lachancea dasiensis]